MRKGRGWERKREEKHPLQTAAKVSPCLYPPMVLHPLFSFYSGYLPSSLSVPYDLFSLVISESLPLVLSGTSSVILPKYLLPQVCLFHHLPAKSAKWGNDLQSSIVLQWHLHGILQVWGKTTLMLPYSYLLGYTCHRKKISLWHWYQLGTLSLLWRAR